MAYTKQEIAIYEKIRLPHTLIPDRDMDSRRRRPRRALKLTGALHLNWWWTNTPILPDPHQHARHMLHTSAGSDQRTRGNSSGDQP